MRGKLVHELKLLVRVRVWGWVRVMVELGTSSTFRGWVRVRVLGYTYGSGVRGRKVKSRDCALASDLERAYPYTTHKIYSDHLPDVVWPARPQSGSPAREARGAAAAALFPT